MTQKSLRDSMITYLITVAVLLCTAVGAFASANPAA
jgi:hypothetical protein